MAIQMTCPGCQKPLQLPDNATGKKVQCPACKHIFLAEFATALPQTEAPPPAPVAEEPATAITESPPPAKSTPAKPRLRPKDVERRDRERRHSSGSGSGVLIAVFIGLAVVGMLAVLPCLAFVGMGFFWVAEAPRAPRAPEPAVVVAEGPVVVDGWMKGGGPPDNRVFDPDDQNIKPPKKGPEPPPPARPFVLPPLPDALEIKPAAIEKETSYKLPGAIGSLRVGGGGRFLVLHFPATRTFGIFDASTAKIERYINAPEDDVVFAAGMTQLVVYAPGSQVIQRYNLLTGQREHLGKLALPENKIEAFCMGHASAGPLLVGAIKNNPKLYDIVNFEEIPLPPNPQNNFGENGPMRLDGGGYWAGATGRVLGHTGNWGMPNGVKTVVFTGGKIERFGEHVGTWFVMPGPDDRHIYPGGHGVMSERVKPVNNVPFSSGPNSGNATHLYLPAHHGPFYLHAQTIDPPNGGIRIYMLGDKMPILTFDKTVACKYGWEALKGLGIEYSIHLIPKAKLLIIVPASRDELRLYPADLEDALDKTGRDYLLFTSTPPASFQKGKALSYQVSAKAKNGAPTFKLETAPTGMTIKGNLIEWTPPPDFTDPRVDVILSARDARGVEAFQTFTLTEK